MELKEEYNLKIEENKIIHTKIHSSHQEHKKMSDLKKKIKDFLKSNNEDKKKVNSEMEIFFLKVSYLLPTSWLWLLSSRSSGHVAS